MDSGDRVLDKDWINDVIRGMKKRDRNRILRASLQSYIEAETLKPYQAELIKLQAATGTEPARRSSFCSMAATLPARGERSGASRGT